MKLLAFLAARFAWTPHAATLPDADAAPRPGEERDCVVVFVHAEASDAADAGRESALRQAQKHVEWLARKKGFETVVLHSFAHLGGTSAAPADARACIEELGARIARRGRRVAITPHGWTNAWEIAVLGEGIAKVWKEIGAGSAPGPASGSPSGLSEDSPTDGAEGDGPGPAPGSRSGPRS